MPLPHASSDEGACAALTSDANQVNPCRPFLLRREQHARKRHHDDCAPACTSWARRRTATEMIG